MSQPIKLSKETIRELQLKELESLRVFKEFCQKNNLLFYFCGGCCIGTLRHQGFIPWDDDVDVFMPRQDYEILLKEWPKQVGNTGRYRLLKTDVNSTFTGNIFATFVDTKYTCVKENQENIDVPHGLVMDIMPLDGCPNGKFKRYMQLFHCLLYSLFMSEVVPEKHGGAVAFFSKILLGIFRGRKIRTKIWKHCEKKMTAYPIEECTYITELCAGPHYMMNKYPKECFESAIFEPFEGELFPIPVGYDTYLKIAFGDYMELPPEDKQVPHHDLVALNLNKSCLNMPK